MTPAPDWLSLDGAQIVAEMVADYEARTGKTLYPGQPEMLLINAFAFRELLLRQTFQAIISQNYVAFATAPALDYLGELLGVVRLPASAASCVLRFTLVAGHGDIVIPAGTRVASADGRVLFSTTANLPVAAGVLTADIEAFADQLGLLGNGYAPGAISTILDPQPYITAATNLATTAGGADAEDDEALRARIKLAPSQFSNAGSTGAYKYFTLSASPAIIDASVTSPTPGTVNVYPLMADGSVTSPSVIALVEAALNDERVRPLTDTVVVLSPTVVPYDIEVEIEAYTAADVVALQAEIEAALAEYAARKQTMLGQDIVFNQLIAASTTPLVYNPTIIQPSGDIVIGPTEVAVVGTITVTITGSTDG